MDASSSRLHVGGPLPGWGGGSFTIGEDVIGWDVRCELFWVHSFACSGCPRSAARLVKAARQQCKAMGFSKMFWQVVPDLTGSAMLKTLAKGRAKIDYIQMYLEV